MTPDPNLPQPNSRSSVPNSQDPYALNPSETQDPGVPITDVSGSGRINSEPYSEDDRPQYIDGPLRAQVEEPVLMSSDQDYGEWEREQASGLHQPNLGRLDRSDRPDLGTAQFSPDQPFSPLSLVVRSGDAARAAQPPVMPILLLAIAVMITGLAINSFWMGLAGAVVALILSARIVWVAIRSAVMDLISGRQQQLTIAIIALGLAVLGILQLSGLTRQFGAWWREADWNAVGALGEVFGALGQIFIAILAVYIAWRQYVISKDLTIQQNLITQQQTIDSYFQGISELVLDEEGLLEDWPQERAIAEGRTAAILSSVDPGGKAKIIRFLSRSRLLTPLRRDRRLGRAMLDGQGGYQEDRDFGIRVIDLGVMLAAANLSATDLRWTDLSEANLIRANLSRCDLVKTNLVRTILYEANLSGADLRGAKFFYGDAQTASPRSRTDLPNYRTGAFTGAVVEGADFTQAQRLSPEQRYYCCAWGGAKTRATMPGGCEGIPNLLES